MTNNPLEIVDSTFRHLPIWKRREDILSKLQTQNDLILLSPTGSGKSLCTPWIIQSHTPNAKICILQPRRLAARSLGHYSRSLLSDVDKSLVGWKFRFDNNTTNETSIIFQTYGNFFREHSLNHQKKLPDWIIFDEFHERNLDMDLILAWIMSLRQQSIRSPRLVFLSADLSKRTLEQYLQVPALSLKVPSFHVQTLYSSSQEPLATKVLESVKNILRHYPKLDFNILVFLPGKSEIKRCQNIILENIKNNEFNAHVLFN